MIPFRSSFIAVAIALILSACGDDNEKPATQTAVKVNDGEITVHQLNAAMTRMRSIPEAQIKGVSQQVLKQLVDQELLVQKAMEGELDRDPQVMQAIEASKRQLLAQAYLERSTGNIERPDSKEVNDFYAAHPSLFAERRIYRLQELAIPYRDGLADRLQVQVRNAKSMNDLVAWLKNEKIPFNANAYVKPAEALPMELVPELIKLKSGEMLVTPMPQGLVVMQVAASEPQPLDREKATPFIEHYLMNKQRMELAKQELDTLRNTAKIAYVGAFSDYGDSAEEKKTSSEKAPAPGTVKDTQTAIDRGVSGLK